MKKNGGKKEKSFPTERCLSTWLKLLSCVSLSILRWKRGSSLFSSSSSPSSDDLTSRKLVLSVCSDSHSPSTCKEKIERRLCVCVPVRACVCVRPPVSFGRCVSACAFHCHAKDERAAAVPSGAQPAGCRWSLCAALRSAFSPR